MNDDNAVAVEFWCQEAEMLGKKLGLRDEGKERLQVTLGALGVTSDIHVDFGGESGRKGCFHLGGAIYLSLVSAVARKAMKAKVRGDLPLLALSSNNIVRGLAL